MMTQFLLCTGAWLLEFLKVCAEEVSHIVSYIDNDLYSSITLHRSGAGRRSKGCRRNSLPCPSTG
jgi:membrane-anchored protein YejM (alkaline phosphatase superfamily)